MKEMVGLKSNFVVDIQYKEIHLFSWRVREKINEIIEKMAQQNLVKTCLIKKKSALQNQIRLKNSHYQHGFKIPYVNCGRIKIMHLRNTK